jgi:hypothetical protein
VVGCEALPMAHVVSLHQPSVHMHLDLATLFHQIEFLSVDEV